MIWGNHPGDPKLVGMGRPWESMHLPISRNESHTSRRKMDVGCRKTEYWVLELYDHRSSLPQ